MFDFRNRTLLLTGANGGISRAIAQTFFALGANCVLTDLDEACLLYTSPSPRDLSTSRMPSSA